MKVRLIAALYCLVTVYSLNAQTNKNLLANDVLKKVSTTLDNVKHLKYDYNREVSYASEGYHNVQSATIFFDFTDTDSLIGFKYQFENNAEKGIFNGSERFVLVKKDKTMELGTNLTPESFSGVPYFYNSIVTLKKVLPSIISDSAISKALTDTIIDKKSYYSVRLVLKSRKIERLGGFADLSAKIDIVYKILINQDFIPVQVLETNDVNKDFVKAIFSNIELTPKQPTELSWYYSSYKNDYKISDKKALKMIGVGEIAPEWELPELKTGQLVKLDHVKGKTTMLVFWIKNCGYCISSVPTLNSISNKYKDLALFAINSSDPKDDVNFFVDKFKVQYPVLYEGGKVTKAYGVAGFPAVVLIDKSGKISYAGFLNKDAIETIIEKEL